MTDKIRVLEMINEDFLGGGQVTVLSLAEHLDPETFDVAVCSRGGGALEQELRKRGVRHFAIPFSRSFKLGLIRFISSILEENEIDILHTHGGVAGLYGRWAAGKCRTPVVVHTLHGIHYLHYRNILLRRFCVFLERAFSNRTDALIFVCESDRTRAAGLRLASPAKMHVIRNGLDFSSYSRGYDRENVKKALDLELRQPVVGTVARLHRQKGLSHLLQAAVEIKAAFPEMTILIVGGGPLRRKLERLADDLGVRDAILFLGERPDVPAILPLFDVFVLPSLWEGLPYVLAEAAVCARPIVATNIDGVREVIRDGENGLLVPPGDPGALTRAVISLLRDVDLSRRLGDKARETIPSQFSLDRMIEETAKLYLGLMKRPG